MDSLGDSSLKKLAESQSENMGLTKLGSFNEGAYLKIIHDLEAHQAQLEIQIRDLTFQESNAVKVSEKFRLLGGITSEMLDLKDLDSIYNYVTQRLLKFIPDTIILYNSIDEANKIVQLETIGGIENKFLKQIFKVSGFNPIGKKFKLIDTLDTYLKSGKFVEYEGNLAEFAASDLSPVIARTIEKLIGLNKIYTIGIKKDEHLLAVIHFFTFNNAAIYDRSFIEAFVKQAGIVIQNKISEKAIKESEEKYRNIFENVQDVYYESSIDGTILEVSPSIIILSKGQYTRKELIGKSLYDFYGDPSERDALISTLCKNGNLSNHEISLQNKDGLYIPCLLSAKLTADSQGIPEKIVGSVHDITHRKKSEDALKISEEKYRDIFKNSPVGIWEEDFSAVKQRFEFLRASGVTDFRKYLDKKPSEIENLASLVKILNVNQASIKMLRGDSKEDLLGSLKRFFIAESLVVFKEELIALESGLWQFDCEVPVVNSKGEKRLLQLSLAVPKHYHHSLERVLVSCIDITERKKGEVDLKIEEEKFRNLFENSPVGISITGFDGSMFMNKSFSDITGYPEEELRELKWMDITHPDDIQISKDALQNLIDRKSPKVRFEKRYIHKNGSIVWTEISIYLQTDSQGIPLFFITVINDVTKRKLTEIELIASKEKAEENDRLKSSFLANMSHEIRTPLNSIIGFAELVGDPDFSPEQHAEFAQMINDSGTNLLIIISDIMDLSKIEAGQVQLKKHKVPINQLIATLKKEFTQKAIKKGIELRLDPQNPNEEIVIESDEIKIRQILTNFLGNAIKFTEKGYIELGFKIAETHVHFQVKDTGIGIPDAYHEKIFERFRQIETAYTRKYGGNGLGLAIAKSLVELLGGEIGMESEVGIGSVFYFSIPIS
jgi:PAS domain S-box-containing protein